MHQQHCGRSPDVANIADASVRKPRLAYVSPLPPERSGISFYSAELLPALAHHYEIEVIVAQDAVSDPWISANCPTRPASWLLEHAASYDRVLYHFGNSTFHQHMFDLLEQVPGTVVLHDFFLSGIVAHSDASGAAPGNWTRELYHSHGYRAVRHRFHAGDTAEVVWAYPCNLSVLQNAKGVIVHSDASRRLFQQWYGEHAADDCVTIPLLRVPQAGSDRASARQALALQDTDFVVCSFGMLGANKLNHRLLDAFLQSNLAKNENCLLVFVGESQNDQYCQALKEKMQNSPAAARIRITEWADDEMFRGYLAAADIGVQLRTLSRGESSSAVLDCMNFGLPTIVNAHGSMADLPDEGTWKLPDNFLDADLVDALETLCLDQPRRQTLGEKARHAIRLDHAPEHCADLYADSIEKFYRDQATGYRCARPGTRETGAPARKRQTADPDCRRYLTIDSGATGPTSVVGGYFRIGPARQQVRDTARRAQHFAAMAECTAARVPC